MLNKPSTPYLNDFQFYEIHESADLHFTSEQIIEAVQTTQMNNDPIINALTKIREIPELITSKIAKRPTQFKRIGLSMFSVLNRTNDELNFALVGKFWQPIARLHKINSATEFIQYDQPGNAKLIFRFQVIAIGAGTNILRTETFVYCPDITSLVLFTPYWYTIRLASGWIRKRILKMVEQRLNSNSV